MSLVKTQRKPSKKSLEINSNWTAVQTREGWRHYRIAGRRYAEESSLHLEMMAVCDRDVRFWVTVDDLSDPEHWAPGWLD